MRKNSWAPPGWPWELELLALIFVITAIAIPIYLQYYIQPTQQQQASMSLIARADLARAQNQSTWQDFTSFFWAIGIFGLYLAFVVMAGVSHNWISTPFTHLLSPVLFSMITYYRLHMLAVASKGAVRVVTGHPGEIAVWVVGVLLITGLVARLRMSRHLVHFKDVEWDIVSPPLFDRSFFELLAYLHPLVYPPRRYKASPQGILIEGWLYVMPIPFDAINSVEPVRKANLMSSGYYLATSAHALVRIQLAEHTQPLFISPRDRDQFLAYCNQYLAPKRSGTHAGTTRSGGRHPKDEAPPAESAKAANETRAARE